MKSFFMELLYVDRNRLINDKNARYSDSVTKDEIYNYQLNKFNRLWSYASRNIPFYQYWKKVHELPDELITLNDLEHFPVLKKRDLQDNEALVFKGIKGCSTISTGGSTGEPTLFPIAKNEAILSYANHYLARGWWGIKPLDEVLLFWGHSHLFGGGTKGRIKELKRKIFDWMINTNRLNAYDMSVDTLEKYYRSLRNASPSMILGYTSIIFKLVKYIDENDLPLGNKQNLKAVVVTSETVTDFDIELIEKVFHVPCVIEYGMAETGVIAHSRDTTKNLQVFWDSFVSIQNEEKVLCVTTLDKQLFPLINYCTDDVVETDDSVSILNMSKITGRKKDVLEVVSGGKSYSLSGILMVHALKSFAGLYDIQVEQLRNGRVKILYTANRSVEVSEIEDFFLSSINVDHKDIEKDCFEFEQVSVIDKTIAGKSRLVVK